MGFKSKGSTVETVLTNRKIAGSSGAVLRQAIAARGRGGFVSHQLTLEQAVQGYEMFDLKQDDCRKVVLTPGSVGSPQPPSAAAR